MPPPGMSEPLDRVDHVRLVDPVVEVVDPEVVDSVFDVVVQLAIKTSVEIMMSMRIRKELLKNYQNESIYVR